MSNIYDLNFFTLIFQLFGLQNFSLKTAMKSSTSKFPSVFYFLIIILWICYASFFLHSWYDDMLDFLNSTNNFLNRVIIIVGFTNYFNVIFIGVFYTIWDNSKLVDFHRKFQRTLNLCFSELHRRAKLRGIKKSLIFTFVFFGWSCSIYVYEICFIYKLDNTTFLLIAKIYTLVVILRFNVYVQLINYRLEVLCQLIQDNLESELNVKFQCVSILRSDRHNLIERRKIVAMRKIYKLIKEMAKIVDQTMAFMVSIQIITTALEMVNFVYIFNNFKWRSLDLWSEFVFIWVW
jgi:hypothetical protein